MQQTLTSALGSKMLYFVDKNPDKNSGFFVKWLLYFVKLIFGKESIMSESIQLTMEQRFNLRSFEVQVARMSHEQAQEFLVQLYEQMMLREAYYKHFLRMEWGLEAGPQH
jgi:hypothetical protein